MAISIIILITIPIFLGIVFVSPFDQTNNLDNEVISEEPNVNILYFILIGIWAIFLMKILFQMKKGTLKTTERY